MQGLCWLREKLVRDCREIGIPIDEVNLVVKPYCKSFLGRYFPVGYKNRCCAEVYLYAYADSLNSIIYDYDDLLASLIHEMVHHIQYSNPNFVTRKGIMHDTEFWKLYNHYFKKAKRLGVLNKDYEGDKKYA